ncbi:hypothetical protein GOP47_0023058 [Adiantum capillus-veneris]|uniref:SKP1 component dimerisation domain-containing protein n=1 Tax=Adiantum capillus-veneris TaxID=13818 RepID=A0A9D4U8J2_ADICA|nr:hypothetical protein GOP47_0023058 [Adiantum capillus-veneris]
MVPGTLIQPPKSLIWLETAEGLQEEVEQEVAMMCPYICKEAYQKGKGSSRKLPIVLPSQVSLSVLKSILEYCRFHQLPGRSNKERKLFDEKFIRLDTKRLCELTAAADSLQMKALVDLTSRALARMIEGKTPEEIRETFHLPDDLTEEEKLEPLKNTTDDPRIRLLNRLYAKKRRELQEREKLKSITQAEVQDERPLEELLSFINGEGEETKSGKVGRCKKKRNHRKKKELSKGELSESASSSRMDLESDETFTFDAELDGDDGLDPLMKEELDREVEDFARRLNSDWPERRRMPDYSAVSSVDPRQLGQIPLRVASVSLIGSWSSEGQTRRTKSNITQPQEFFPTLSNGKCIPLRALIGGDASGVLQYSRWFALHIYSTICC